MGPGIIIPVVVLAIVVPIGFTWARRLRDAGATGADVGTTAPATRLTSNVLREIPSPPWRVVYEIAPDKLGGVEHVLIGPPGIFAVATTMEPVPAGPPTRTDAHAMAQAAIVRGDLDDALRRCGMTSRALVRVHWGPPNGGPTAVTTLPGVVAVDGRSLVAWTHGLDDSDLGPAQVDLAWQTVTTAIGRPDPLA